MKIAIFFDSFSHGGGAEKLVLELAKTLKADVFTSGYKPEQYKEWVGKTKIFNIGNFSLRFSPRLGFIESAFRFAWFKPEQKYDLYIFSGFFSIFAAWRLKPNIWYCCQPNRTIYDLKKYQKEKSGLLAKVVIEIYSFFWKPLDQWIAKSHIQKIVCISETVQARVKKYYELNSKVVYPPIETKRHWFEKFGDFFFFAGRLISEKRVELLLDAFSEMPQKKLVIAGTGPLAEKIEEHSKKYSNIVFEGRISEKRLDWLLANCLATVYLPVQEDFGMFPLEGNAAGKICVVAKEGGCVETIIHGKNGFLIKPEKEELKKIIHAFDIKKAERMKADCVNRAKLFDKSIFARSWKKLLGADQNVPKR